MFCGPGDDLREKTLECQTTCFPNSARVMGLFFPPSTCRNGTAPAPPDAGGRRRRGPAPARLWLPRPRAPGEAGSRPLPLGPQIRLWGSPAGGGSGPRRRGRRPSAPRPLGPKDGAPPLSGFCTVFSGSRCRARTRAEGRASRRTNPAEGWKRLEPREEDEERRQRGLVAAGQPRRGRTDGRTDAGRRPQRCPRRKPAEQPLRSLSPHPRVGSRGDFRPAQARWWRRAARSPSPSGLPRAGVRARPSGCRDSAEGPGEAAAEARGWRGGPRVSQPGPRSGGVSVCKDETGMGSSRAFQQALVCKCAHLGSERFALAQVQRVEVGAGR